VEKGQKANNIPQLLLSIDDQSSYLGMVSWWISFLSFSLSGASLPESSALSYFSVLLLLGKPGA
jgi:hypothetical protein